MVQVWPNMSINEYVPYMVNIWTNMVEISPIMLFNFFMCGSRAQPADLPVPCPLASLAHMRKLDHQRPIYGQTNTRTWTKQNQKIGHTWPLYLYIYIYIFFVVFVFFVTTPRLNQRSCIASISAAWTWSVCASAMQACWGRRDFK